MSSSLGCPVCGKIGCEHQARWKASGLCKWCGGHLTSTGVRPITYGGNYVKEFFKCDKCGATNSKEV